MWLKYNQKSEISKKEWLELKIDEKPKLTGDIYVGIKYGNTGEYVSMAVAVKTSDGKNFVEALDCRPVRAGNDWILEYLTAINPRSIVVDGSNGQQVLLDDMKDSRIKQTPIFPKVAEIITANALFEQGVFQHTIRHADQPSLTQAASNCERRAIGSHGGFGYKAMKEGIEISLLDAVILAHWKCHERKEKKKQQARY